MKWMDRKKLGLALTLLAVFALWTALVCAVDVQPIGPEGSEVGMAALNVLVHSRIGVHMGMYVLTDWLGLVPVAVMLGFAVLGVVQWIVRRDIRKVDRSLFALGAVYALTAAAYLLFEECVVNCRPVLIEGRLEASYPSSTTLLVLCVIPTAVMQLRTRLQNRLCRRMVCAVLTAFAVLMVAGRLLSGVHWATDLIGGVLCSAGLVTLYSALE